MSITIRRLSVILVTNVLVAGCGQTSSSPTSPSSLLPSASSLSDGDVTASSDGSPRASVVHDARGDSTSPSPYTDVVHASVKEQGHGTLFFKMVLGGSVPATPTELFLLWVFHVDTNPATAPDGLYNEHIVRVRRSGGAFVGEVIDRTDAPTLVTTVVPFKIDGSTVKLFVPLGTLGNPSRFRWNAATRPQPPAAYLDFAPNGGAATDLATWTRKK